MCACYLPAPFCGGGEGNAMTSHRRGVGGSLFSVLLFSSLALVFLLLLLVPAPTSASAKDDLDAKMAEIFNSRRKSGKEREQNVSPKKDRKLHGMQKLKWWKDVKPSRLKSRYDQYNCS